MLLFYLRELRNLAFFVLPFAATATAFSQSSIVGTVTDPSGGVVASSTVHITNESTSQVRDAVTNGQGYYVVPSLAPSTYTLKVEAPGFSPFTRSGILLETDQTATNNVTVSLTAVVESVTVTGAELQVNTTNATLSEVVDQHRVIDLPLNGRNAANLTLITAGTVLGPSGADEGNSKTFPGAVTISSNGARQNQNSFRLDGATNNDIYTNVNQPFPFPDALAEFSVQTSNASSRFGGNAGAVVNVVTKSGTNAFHGDIFEFVRNAVFNARNYFADTRDQLKRNQFGGTIGGPVTIPGIYHGRDKTFFFTGYQATRIRNNVNGLSSFVPTQANLKGDFSSLLAAGGNNPLGSKIVHIKDLSSPAKCDAATGNTTPTSGIPGGCYANNQIPVSLFDPASVALTALLPTATGTGNVIYARPLSQNFDEGIARLDHSLTENDHLLARYYYNRFVNGAFLDKKNYLNNTGASTITFQSATIGETHTFNASTLNEFHAAYGREISVRSPAPGSVNAADLGVRINQPAGDHIIELLSVSGYFSVSQTDPASFARNQYTLNDDFSLIRGSHSITLGGQLIDGQVLLRNQFHQPGNFGFTADYNNDALASFLTGNLRTFLQGNGEFKDNRLLTYGIFAEDAYHVSRRVTITAGLRYDPFFPWHETKGRSEVFDPASYAAGRVSQIYTNAPKGLLFPGDTGVPQYGLRPSFKNVAPRLGFALDLDGDGKTALRGGFGMFFDAIQNGIYNNRFVDVTPFSLTVNLTAPRGPLSDPYRGITNPFPAPQTPPKNIVFPTPLQVVSYDPGHGGVYQTPVIYDYNLVFEHQFPMDLLSRIAYVGSHSSHLLESVELSPAVYSGSLVFPDSRRYFNGYGSIAQATQDINSNYHSLQATLNKSFSRGYTVLANYTWSHSIDDLNAGQGVTTSGTGTPSPIPWYLPGRHQFDRGASEFDRTHRFVASFIYEAPGFARAPSALRYVIGGWRISGIFNAQSGAPLTVTAGIDRSGTALGSDRAFYNGRNPYGPGSCGMTSHCVDYLTPAAFSLPAQGTYGNAGKGQFRGPHEIILDSGLSKEVPLYREDLRLQFKAEFFNVLNQTNYSNPGVNLSAAAAGSIRSSGDPRIGQLALKLLF